MLTEFNSLPPESRIWIFQSSREFTDIEVREFQKESELFVDSWTAHQAGLKAAAKIEYGYFLIIAVDQSYNGASGCSIDKMTNFVKNLGSKSGIDFFNRMNLAYRDSSGNINLIHVNNLSVKLNSGETRPETHIFNNLITEKGELSSGWEIPLKDSWAQQFAGKGITSE